MDEAFKGGEKRDEVGGERCSEHEAVGQQQRLVVATGLVQQVSNLAK